MKVIIIGGGVIGLCSAYYLNQAGCEVTVLDNTDMNDGASYGNAGHIVPSHFIPLASPGIVSQGLRWMLDASSPFYVKPRLDASLIKWGYMFWRQCSLRVMEKNTPCLQQLLVLSRQLFNEMELDTRSDIGLIKNGLLVLYKTSASEKHEQEAAAIALKNGMVARLLKAGDVQDLEPGTKVDVKGGVWYGDDAHMDPFRFMKTLKKILVQKGVQIISEEEVTRFETRGPQIISIITPKNKYEADEIIMANGCWMPALAARLGIKLLMQPGKGYSLTYPSLQSSIRHPAILVDHRVAITPLPDGLRMAGTMELSGYKTKDLPMRIEAIKKAVPHYYPQLQTDVLPAPAVWSGFRPLSPDGLPYIGRHSKYKNLVLAGGHAMLGLSLATGTGLLVKQLIKGEKTSMPVDAFAVERFDR